MISNESENFALILNPLDMTRCGEFEIAPGFRVRRATRSEISEIQDWLRTFKGTQFPLPHTYYEKRYIEERVNSGLRGEFLPLPESEWKYNVVAFTGTNLNAQYEIQLASNVADLQLDVPIAFQHGGGRAGHLYRPSHFFENYRFEHPVITVSDELLKDVADSIREVRLLDGEFREIRRALKVFDDLKNLPNESDFQVLGLFSIIEMLITHNPQLEDAGDSITHQMRSKIPLLSRRFRRPLNYHAFGDVAPEKVWAKLYQHRSTIAHGGEPDFTRGDLQPLKDSRTVLTFLRDTVRALIRHSLREPLLYRDLRDC